MLQTFQLLMIVAFKILIESYRAGHGVLRDIPAHHAKSIALTKQRGMHGTSKYTSDPGKHAADAHSYTILFFQNLRCMKYYMNTFLFKYH